MAETTAGSQRFTLIVAVLIALVSITGAAVACRVADASERAGDADDAGILAAADREAIRTEGFQVLYSYLSVYARSARQTSLSESLADAATRIADPIRREQVEEESDALYYAANTVRAAIPPEYLDRDLQFDRERASGELIAERSIRRDTDPQPFFDEADQQRFRSEALLAALVALGISLLLLTLAEAIEHWVRYGLAAAGVTLAMIALFVAVLLEVLL